MFLSVQCILQYEQRLALAQLTHESLATLNVEVYCDYAAVKSITQCFALMCSVNEGLQHSWHMRAWILHIATILIATTNLEVCCNDAAAHCTTVHCINIR